MCACVLMHVCLKETIIFNVLIKERFMQMREFYSFPVQAVFLSNQGVSQRKKQDHYSAPAEMGVN